MAKRVHVALFLCNRKFRWNPLLHKKSPARQDPEAAERQMSLKRPAAGRESCKQDSFLCSDKIKKTSKCLHGTGNFDVLK